MPETADLPDWLPILLEFYENEEAAEWLVKPHVALDEESPLEAIRNGRQWEVAELVETLNTGAEI